MRKAIEIEVVRDSANERHTVGAKFAAITELYRAAHLPTLRHSTHQLNNLLLEDYIEPGWSSVPLRDVSPFKERPGSEAWRSWRDDKGGDPVGKKPVVILMPSAIQAEITNSVPITIDIHKSALRV